MQRKTNIRFRASGFELPPVRSALVIGKRARMGSEALQRALEEMMPDAFVVHRVDHEMVESVLLNHRHVRGVDAEAVVRRILAHTESLMDETSIVHVDLELSIEIEEVLES